MPLSAARVTLGSATVALAMLLTAPPANAVPVTHSAVTRDGVDRRVLLTPAEQPPAGEAYGQPWINPYFEPAVTGPTCWRYGSATGASAGLSARFSTPTWFHAYNDVWVFPSADAAAAFERQWRADLATCVDRNPPGESGSFVLDVTKAGEAGGVDVLRVTSGLNPYPQTQHWWVAVVRQGTAVYAVQLLDYRDGDPRPVPFDDTVAAIRKRLATYYP
ncbi:hypothetical protein GCM10010149_28650 [Nonomuraea roseoviolacea subsp. roseoviolacea]|uniref:hypothetical protein n=1 Tax=Nonomuraea roseoviolacea TaxID=103837 RepID=UPI0031D7A6E6